MKLTEIEKEALISYLAEVLKPFVEKRMEMVKSEGIDLSDVGEIGLVRICLMLAVKDIYLTPKLKEVYKAAQELGL